MNPNRTNRPIVHRNIDIPLYRTLKREFSNFVSAAQTDLCVALAALIPKPVAALAENYAQNAIVQEELAGAVMGVRKKAEEYQDKGLRFHYNNFLVVSGVAGMACNGGGRCKWVTGFATNTKWEEGEQCTKHCSEMRLMSRMEELHATALCTVVTGIPRIEDPYDVLHPCEVCRKLMRTKYRDIFRKFSRFVLINPEQTVRKGFDIVQLMQFHNEHEWN